MWDLTILVPDHCLSFYFDRKAAILSKSHNPQDIKRKKRLAMPRTISNIHNSNSSPFCLFRAIWLEKNVYISINSVSRNLGTSFLPPALKMFQQK